MRLINKIDEIMLTDFRHVHFEKSAILSEPIVGSTCSPVNLIASKGEMLIYQVDKKIIQGNPIEKFPYFNDGPPKKIPDYIAFYQPESVLYIFVCELKSDNKSGALNQLSAGKILANFIVDTAHRCLNHQCHDKHSIKGLLFSNAPRIYKKPVFDEKHGIKFATLMCGDKYSVDSFCHS